MTQFHADLTHRHPPSRYDISPGGLARALGLCVAVAAGLGAYIAVAVNVTTRLHLEGGSAYWLSAGVLCLLVAAFGWGRYMVGRRLGNSSELGITLYVLAIGVGMFGFGLWRQHAFDAAQRRCREALEAAPDIHARLRVYRTHETLPTLRKGGLADTITCEQLVHF